jgi:hypothetical protein
LQIRRETGLASIERDASIYSSVRVKIIKRPEDTSNEMLFTSWRVGETYDVSLEVASLLIVEGCAQLEMRAGTDRRRSKRWGDPERRQVVGGRW